MHLEMEAPAALPAPAPPRRRFDRVEAGTLAVFAVLSLWVLALDLWQVVEHGRVWTGTDGVYPGDQMQYLAWIRSASHHFLVSNMYVLRATTHDYFQPAVLISAGLTLIGLPPWLALLIWKPIAVAATFFGFRAYVHRSLPGTAQRRVALVLALFFGSYSIVYGSWGVVGDLMPTFLTWGYTFALLSIGLMVVALLTYDRARTRGAAGVVPGLAAALAALLHPWQGELFLLLLAGTELAMWRLERRPPPWKLLALTVGLTGVALLYYLLLGRTDLTWKLARDASKHAFSLWTILLGVAPLLVPALVAARPRRVSFLAILTRAWPVAAFSVWVFSATALGATPLHAFQAITLPLAVLAVEGVERLRPARLPRPRLVLAAVLALLTVPATVKLMSTVRDLAAPTPANANFITTDERSALHYLTHKAGKGGVLTRVYLGTVVPAETDRTTFVGDCLWSQPHCGLRATLAQNLLDGVMTPAQAQAFVRQSGARFVLSDCQTKGELSRSLAPVLVSVRRFGCAAVYELDAPGRAQGPLAQSARDAAVRPSRRQ